MCLRTLIWPALAILCVGAGCAGPYTTGSQRDDVSASRPAEATRPPDTPELIEDLTIYPGRTHWVQPGETLYSLARQYYGDDRQWRRILTANQNRLRDPNNIPVGTKLIIPPSP